MKNLARFFTWTGAMPVVVAAGLVPTLALFLRRSGGPAPKPVEPAAAGAESAA